MTRVKSLHSGDPDEIQTRGLQVPDNSGVNDLQVPDYSGANNLQVPDYSGVNDLQAEVGIDTCKKVECSTSI